MTPRRGRRREPLAAQLLRELEGAEEGHRWPSRRWEHDPVAYAREVLRVAYLSPEQEAILRDVAQPRARVAVTSGHKTGKDFVGGIVANWWYSLWDDARVMITAVTGHQVKNVCWREVTAHHNRSGVGPFPLDGSPALLPSTGVVCGQREIKGFTCDVKEAVAGISSGHVLYLITEASGVPDYVFEALTGNLAGKDCRVLLLSQPTRNDGFFFQAFHKNAPLWKCHTLRSDQTVNVRERRVVVDGMAGLDWLEEVAREWGAPPRWREIAGGAPITTEDVAQAGPIWLVRVWGRFALGEAGRLIPLALVGEAEKRWQEWRAAGVRAAGRLVLGLDVAQAQDGDECAAASRRGHLVLEVEAWQVSANVPEPLAAADVARRAIEIVRRHRRPTEPKAVINVDVGGTFGAKVRAALELYSSEIDVVAVHFGSRPRNQRAYGYLRDELWFGAREWLREGGALPEDAKLEAELTAPGFEVNARGQQRVEDKKEIRKRLGRSTDRADAVLLALYEGAAVRATEADEDALMPDRGLDPYGGGGGGIDPYGDTGGIGWIDPYG